LQTQIHHLQMSAREAELNTTAERERAERLERESQQVRAQMEGELGTHWIVEERNAQLGDELDVQRRELAGALADAAEQGRVAEGLRQELKQVQMDFEDIKALEARNAEKIAHLLEDQADHLRILEPYHQADRDRTVLERQFHELKAVQEHTVRQLEGLKVEMDVANTDSLGLREEGKQLEREVREAWHRSTCCVRTCAPGGLPSPTLSSGLRTAGG
jgi:autophagy-related protein 11